MSKNVAVFVDVANIFYAAKAAGVDIDYVTLLRAATAGRDFVRAYAYTGLDPENENQRQFHAFLARSGYKVISKDIRKYGDGRIKANLDIELVVDMMRMAQHLDICVVVSGDGDFAPAIRAVQQMGVRVEVVSFRGNTSSDLIEAADVFTDITQLARVEKGERSGRRVAAEGDLSMTQVPEKESEGPVRRRRTRRGAEATPAAVAPTVSPVAGSAAGMPGNLIVLPGERLSRADGTDEPEETLEADEPTGSGGPSEVLGVVDSAQAGNGQLPEDGEAARRRRRRRGGRGRGRGRRAEGEEMMPVPGPGIEASIMPSIDSGIDDDEYLDEVPVTAPQHSTFGSVWDTQLGVPAALTTAGPGETEPGFEDEDEPEIPEYLLAERRQRAQRNQRGGRGAQNRQNYRTAMDRERFGRAGSAFGPPARGNDRPRQGVREMRPSQPQRFERPPREAPFAPRPPAPASSEPWSEVPPEVQELLRAELARRSSRPEAETGPERPETSPSADVTEPSPKPRRRTSRPRATGDGAATAASPNAIEAVASTEATVAPEAPKRTTRSRRASAATPPAVSADASAAESSDTTGTQSEAPARRATRTGATTRRAASRTKAATADVPEAAAAAGERPAPKRRSPRRATTPDETAET